MHFSGRERRGEWFRNTPKTPQLMYITTDEFRMTTNDPKRATPSEYSPSLPHLYLHLMLYMVLGGRSFVKTAILG